MKRGAVLSTVWRRAGGLAHLVILLALLLGAMLADGPAATAQDGTEAEPVSLQQTISGWEDANSSAEGVIRQVDALGEAQIGWLRELLDGQREEIRSAREAVLARMRPIRSELDTLGPPPPEGQTEADGVATERARLNEAMAEVEAEGKQIDLALTRTNSLLVQLSEIRARRFANELLTAGPSGLAPATWGRTAVDLQVAVNRVLAEMDRVVSAEGSVRAFEPLILVAIGLLLGLGLRRLVVEFLLRRVGREDRFLRRAAISLGIAAARLILPTTALVLLLTALSLSGIFGTYTTMLVGALGKGLLIVIAANVFSGIYFAPRSPELRLSDLSDDGARRAVRLVLMLAGIFAADILFRAFGDAIGVSQETLSAGNLVLVSAGAWVLWRLARVLREVVKRVAAASAQARAAAPAAETDEAEAQTEPMSITFVRVLRRIFQGVAILAPVLALTGYYAASRFAYFPVVSTTAVLAVCLVISRAARVFVESRISEKGGTGANRLRLLPMLLGVVLFICVIPALVLIWGGDWGDVGSLWSIVTGGFMIGEVQINLADAMTLGLVFTIGYFLTRGVQNVVRRSVLPNTGMDTGATAAVTAGIGYTGIIISALVAITAAGLDLSNLAIVAGALSLGIGFGLQNIVNNFVSGIILLIERPIKVGDWVELASGQGYVKRINVRATEIQTFDRSSLFVPNSELISGAVTNWTHENSQGRIIVKVGVAYGSDVRLVEKILLEIAEAHAMLMRRPGPYVVFAGFGADSLDFEIRGVLRDVNWVLNVRSDINFEIYRRFAENNIGIPFRQHDVHILDPKSVGAALAEGFRGIRPGEPPARGREAKPESDVPDMDAGEELGKEPFSGPDAPEGSDGAGDK